MIPLSPLITDLHFVNNVQDRCLGVKVTTHNRHKFGPDPPACSDQGRL